MNAFVVVAPDDLRALVSEAVTTALDARHTHTPPTTQPNLMSREAACQFLGITHPTLRRMVIRGTIASVHVGRRVMFRRADLEAFAATGGTTV